MKKLILGVSVLCFCSCAPKSDIKVNTPSYFDLTQYFDQEIKRLQHTNPEVEKTVWVKNETEKQNVQIKNWKQELAIFRGSDINKESWRGEFTIATKNNVTSYFTNNHKIPIKRLEVLKRGNKVTSLKIYRLSQNYLYRSADTLSYYPDSIYEISVDQKVKLLDNKAYKIKGVIKPLIR